ncbi:MAG TPA: hypothetical protein VHL34_11530 [Rhizomicrobium sp.]|jgi:hypothetical protein|nr:hypothetical protein [Rhizomicrobium sp.]
MKRALVLAAVALLAAAPAFAAPMKSWTNGDKTSVFQVGLLKLTFWQARDDDGAAVAALQVASAGTRPISMVGQAGLDPARASWAVTKLDPANATPQVIFSSFSGGAHCCTRIYVAERLQSGWTAFDLGLWNGDGLANVPVDVDGDKIPDIVLSDDRFLYTFDSYAASWSPPIVINVVGGKVDDVSKQPRYKKLYASEMDRAKAQCATHANGACAGYAANAARIGRFDEAWKFVLANYDRTAKWDYPGRCRGQTVNSDCKGEKIKPKDFPESLRWFLEDNGYIARR